MENAIMVHVYFERNAGYEDNWSTDIAVEECPNIFDDYEYAKWKKELYQAVEARYNQYHYWDSVEITQAIFVDGKMHIEKI